MAETVENKEQAQEQDEQKPVPYTRFKEVLDRTKAAEDELKRIKDQADTDKKKLELDELVKKGKYDEIVSKLENERKTEREQMQKIARSSLLTTLGLKHGIAKTEYTDLFRAEVKMEGLEIKNVNDIEAAFETFKQDNPHLFVVDEKKSVPKTDNKPQKKVDNYVKPSEVNGYDMILQGLSERNK